MKIKQAKDAVDRMSVRPIQADDVRSAAEAASRFTLRGVVTSETLGLAAATNAPAPPRSVPNVNTGALKFSLGKPTLQAPPVARPATPVSKQLALPPKKTDTHEVMRLTAYVDDLSKRLRETGNKLKSSETALARSNQALAAERHTAQQKLGSMKLELDAAHETESKLRSELGALSAKQQVKKENKEFLSSVRSAIATEAIEASKLGAAKELEQRLEAMKDQQLQLEAHLAALAMDKTSAEKELEVANEVVVATQQKSLHLSEKMAAQEERLAAMAQLAPVTSEEPKQTVDTADLLMMDVPAADTTPDPQPSAAPVDTNCFTEDTENCQPSSEYVPHTIPAPVFAQSWAPEVTGDAPKSLLPTKMLTNITNHANRALPGAFVGNHFNHDAPVTLCHTTVSFDSDGDLKSVTPQQDNTQGAAADPSGMAALIEAIVNDVRFLLETSKQEVQDIINKADQSPPELYVSVS